VGSLQLAFTLEAQTSNHATDFHTLLFIRTKPGDFVVAASLKLSTHIQARNQLAAPGGQSFSNNDLIAWFSFKSIR